MQRFSAKGGRNLRRAAVIEADEGEPCEKGLGHHEGCLVVEAWEEEHMRLLVHRSENLLPGPPSAELDPLLEPKAAGQPTESRFVGSRAQNNQSPVRYARDGPQGQG